MPQTYTRAEFEEKFAVRLSEKVFIVHTWRLPKELPRDRERPYQPQLCWLHS